ncbi:CHAT domain-containing protein [Candidatus Protochlamydia amoebophila]|uniref:CHAT domain-containing protein n=1 Tax=Protochlamydia amoebophila (strain UWE25) TaxID=264201 RepID=Q6MF67_PARUW|nr:CHAT domain-containing protein [Candidatus Protochlamydia amoebophila]CAF22782.1 unnamed protein product [Candidatus Protochlamydia amoebophila UWE25]
MHVESVKFSTPYYLHYPHLSTIPVLDHVKGLIEAYKTKSNLAEDIFVNAKLLLKKVIQLEDIGVKRECFCRLLKLGIEEVQNLIEQELAPLLNLETILYDIQHNQAQQLIELEEIVSETIEAKLTSSQLNFLVPVCEIYQSILEHLWLLPYFEFGNCCSHLLIQNKEVILGHMDRWKGSLDQLAGEEKIEPSIPENLEKAILRIFEPLPAAIAKEIDMQKSVIKKSEGIPLTLLEIIADVYLSIDDNDEAISCYQTALNLTEDQSAQAWIYMGIGRAHANAQQHQLAEEDYKKALSFCPQVDVLLAIKIHGNLAALFNNFGPYEKAIFHAKEALELTKHPSVQKNELDAFDSKFGVAVLLGNIYGTFRDYDREIDYQTQALKMAKKSDLFSNSLGTAYSNLGRAYCHKKNFPKGIKCYNKALKLTEESLAQANILLSLGNASFNSGEFEEAIRNYKKVDKIGNQDTKKASFLGLGLCYQALENEDQAIQCIEKSICLSKKTKDRRSEAIGYHNLGIVYKESNPGLAEEKYRRSIAIYTLLHQELKNHHQWQITFFEEQALPLLNLESLLLKQGKTEEALQITDFRRSRALVSALTLKFQKDDALSSFGLTAQEMQALAQKLNTCFIIYSFPFESTDSITVWVVPPQGEIICQQLPLGILAEEVEEAPYIFKTFPPIFEPTVAKRRPFLPPKKTRSLTTHSLLENLTRGKSGDQSNATDLQQTFKERLALCYETLIAPLESYFPKDPQQVITIIPDGFLAQIPFAAFLDKEGTYLIEKHPISIVPSVGILKLLDKIPKDFPKNSLVIGNPKTPYPKDTIPFAEKEAQAIVSPLLKTFPEKILLQEKATVQSVLEGMRDARWIHLACHGLTGTKPEEKLDPHSVFEGLFKLAPDESHSRGYLHAQEIASLTLRTELVFMSTCFSGRGKLHGEGSVGPVWSFLAAGALSTVATYCELQDSDLTLQMVDTFYRHLLGIGVEKLNKAQALQKALKMAIEQKREKPHLWGAFFLSGLHE